MRLFPPARWILRPPDPERAAALAADLSISPLAAQLLLNRELGDPDAARVFLRAALEDLSEPALLLDLPRAAELLLAALAGGKRIIIYGDYDADGVTSTAILVRGLRALGARPEVFIPRRDVEGYGLNGDAIARLGGPGVLVAVDCGMTAVEEVAQAAAQGLEVIILDHHLPGSALPAAAAVVGPKREGQPPVTPFAACGLAFQTVRAIWRLAGRNDEPVDLLDLVAVGTLADIVPLVGDNRILARQGLARMAAAPSLGIAALLRVADVAGAVRIRDVTFGLAPRLNAAGRLGDATVAVTLLTTEDPVEAADLARRLDEENRRRQEITETVLASAAAQVEEGGWKDGPALVVAGEGWHPGVIGIVASHLKERYNRPVVMIAVANGVGKGSARSIEPLPMVDALGAVGDLLSRFGGHAMAAGLTIAADHIEDFRRRFTEEAGRRLTPEDLTPSLTIDAEVALPALTPALAREIEQMAPFGPGNPEPVVILRGLRAAATRVVGDGHLRVGLTDGRAFVDAIGFARGDVAELLAFTGARVDVAAAVELDRWGGERVSLVLRDLTTPGLDLEAVLADGELLLDRLFARAEEYLRTGFGGIEGAWSFYTKVAGVTFEGRQEWLPSVRPGQPLHLVRQPSNPYDPHAVAILTAEGRQLGFLSARIAGRLAPSIDAGTRYTATASQLTGGGDRSYGLNIFIQREESAFNADGMAWTSWRPLPAEALLERLRILLHAGRPLRRAQAETIERLLTEGRVKAALGPGRRGAVTAVMAAAALAAQRARPAVIALSLVSQAERWFDTFGPLLREVGFRVYRAHGALSLRPQQRLARALVEGRADIVLASAAWLAGGGMGMLGEGLHSAIIIDDADMPGETAGAVAAAVSPHLPRGGGLARFHWESGSSHSDAAGDPDGAGVVQDDFVRANLRLADRRDGADHESLLATLAAGGEKTLIFTPHRGDAVALATSLRGREGMAAVAYYHGGLPARVRRVIEQLFLDRKVGVLVSTGAFPEAFAPGDIAQVILGGLPQSRAQLQEMAALAGLSGKPATVVLAYRRDDAAHILADVEERFPSRDRLAAFYRLLRTVAQARRGEALLWPGEALGSALAGAGWSVQTSESALDTLAQAGVIQREILEGRWRIELPDGGRRDLTDSLRYIEGDRERGAVNGLMPVAFGPASAILQGLASARTREKTST